MPPIFFLLKNEIATKLFRTYIIKLNLFIQCHQLHK